MAVLIEETIRELPTLRLVREMITSPSWSDEEIDEAYLTGFEFFSAFAMGDDSMEPIIPKGAGLSFSGTDELADGDLVVVRFSDGSYSIRLYVRIDLDTIMLVAYNKRYENIVIKESEESPKARVITKCTSMMIDFG